MAQTKTFSGSGPLCSSLLCSQCTQNICTFVYVGWKRGQARDCGLRTGTETVVRRAAAGRFWPVNHTCQRKHASSACSPSLSKFGGRELGQWHWHDAEWELCVCEVYFRLEICRRLGRHQAVVWETFFQHKKRFYPYRVFIVWITLFLFIFQKSNFKTFILLSVNLSWIDQSIRRRFRSDSCILAFGCHFHQFF